MSHLSHPLNNKQRDAAIWLAYGRTIAETSSYLNVNRKTIFRWQRIPAFQEEMANVVRQMRTGLNDRLIRLADKSLDVLEKELTEHGINKSRCAQDMLKMLGIHHFVLPGAAATPPAASESGDQK